MPLAIGNKTVDLNTPGASSRTFSHNMSAGSGGYLILLTAMGSAVDYTGVTYAGAAMTQIGVFTTNTTSTRWAFWGLANPATGANNVVVSFTGGQYNPVSSFAVSFTGSSGWGNIVSDDTSSSPNSTSITVSLNSVIIGSLVAGSGVSHVITLNGSSRTLEFTNAINNSTSGAISATGLSAGSKTVSVSAATSVAGYYLEVKEAVAAGGQSGSDFLMFT